MRPPTVFVTAFDQHALRAFDVAAVDYLLKPFDDERFAAVLARFMHAGHGAARLAGCRQLQHYHHYHFRLFDDT